tara:strand:+ start:360 stop:833 length:474 start_codon:yes stop_codon:yes gene_type:complete
MRQPQNAKRGRGRGRRGNGNAQPNVPNRNTSYESNGPDVKLRGNAQQLNEKYLALAHDAAAAGERITAEAYTQFADHYFRLHQAAVDAAEERRAQHAERQPRAEASPQPAIGDERPQPQAEAAGNGAAEKADGAEVVDLTPAKLSEMVQEEQDSASA